MTHRDKTYCAAACRNTECDHNREYAPLDEQGLPVRWAGLSDGCPGYVPTYNPNMETDHG